MNKQTAHRPPLATAQNPLWARRLRRSLIVGLAIILVVLLARWAGLFASAQERAADHLYATRDTPGTDIVIVAIDEKSQQALGEWPWTLDRYVQLFGQLDGASAIGFDVLLTDAGLQDDRHAPALLDAVRRQGNVVVPWAALELVSPRSSDELYAASRYVETFPALAEAAAARGSVNQALDRDGIVRRVPLLIDDGGAEPRQAFGLQIVNIHLGLEGTTVSHKPGRLTVGGPTEIAYQVPTAANGTMLINYLGATNTFSTTHTYHSFVDVIEEHAPPDAFDRKIVLVGMMNTLSEMDIHRTPVSAQRMSGIEVQANIIHTLLHHRALTPQRPAGVVATIVLLALFLALVLAYLGPILGALFAVLLAAGYFMLSGMQFQAGILPRVFYPYFTIALSYAAQMAARFAGEQAERNRVTDVFGRFISPTVRDAVVDLALRDPDLIQPGGRQIEISVLFADIRGFTGISETRPPSEVVEILNCYLDSMEEQIFLQGGTLDKYTGDGMMVLFGAPLEQTDHAERAVRAALGMQRAAKTISAQNPDQRSTFVYGIGITTGQAVVGNIGSRRRLDYTAIGDTVNLAARLESVAPPDTILISTATWRRVQHVVKAERLDPVRVKGKARPVPVYRVLGLKKDAGPTRHT
jgi:adenylate cyclase